MDEKYKFLRTNALIILAYLMIGACLIITLRYSVNDYAKSIVTLILGRFRGYIDQAYGFEFGTTRRSKMKDETISSLTDAVNQAPKPP